VAEVGILRPDERVELIEGALIDMAPIGSRHNSAVDRVAAALDAAVEGRAIVRAQGSVSARANRRVRATFRARLQLSAGLRSRRA
jgi:hypothetical protein